jgi:hypothetical protein
MRSTALVALQWFAGITLVGLLAAIVEKAPAWVLIGLGITFVILVAAFLGAYFYLLMYDRDALRSERFTLSKIAMERGLLGDSTRGLVEPEALLGQPRQEVELGKRLGRPE